MIGDLLLELLFDYVGSCVGELVAGVLGWLWRAYARALNVPILVAVLLDCLAGTGEGMILISRSGWSIALGTISVIACPALAIASSVVVWRRLRTEPAQDPHPSLEARLRTVDLRPARKTAAAEAPNLPRPAPPYAPWRWSDRAGPASARPSARGD